MGENQKNNNVTGNGISNIATPDMSMPDMEMPEIQIEQEDNSQVAEAEKVDLNKTVFGTSTYQMVVGKRTASLARFEEFKVTKPMVAQEIENFVSNFNYKNPVHVQNFASNAMGKNSIKYLAEFMKNNRDGQAYDDIREMLLDFIDDMKPREVKKSLLDRLKEFVEKRKTDAEIIQLETARIDEIIDTMTKRTESNLGQIVGQNRAEIKKALGAEQQRALYLDKFIIAGELILKKMEEEYLPVVKAEYENDPTSTDKKLALKEAEERTIEFVSRLNNVIANSAITLINLDILLKQKETNKMVQLFLQGILENTIPTLAQECMINILNRKNQIPSEEAVKIQEITEQILMKNAKEVGELYIATIEQSGRPFISIKTLEEVARVSKDTNDRADELKKQQLSMQLECHEKLEVINNNLMITATEMAYKSMSKEELEEMQKLADSFKTTI